MYQRHLLECVWARHLWMTLAPVFMSRKAPVPYVALVCPACSATHTHRRVIGSRKLVVRGRRT